MFGDLYDAISFLWSAWWPVAEGEITAIDIERVRNAWNQGHSKVRLAIAYKFSVGEDGPYSGEYFWRPVFNQVENVRSGRRALHLRQRVAVRYRSDDPSVNALVGGMARLRRKSV